MILYVLKKIRERALYKNFKFNIIFCMKVIGETFSFHHKRKRAEEERYQKYQNFQAK